MKYYLGLLVGIGVYFYTLKSWDQEFLIIIGEHEKEIKFLYYHSSSFLE